LPQTKAIKLGIHISTENLLDRYARFSVGIARGESNVYRCGSAFSFFPFIHPFSIPRKREFTDDRRYITRFSAKSFSKVILSFVFVLSSYSQNFL